MPPTAEMLQRAAAALRAEADAVGGAEAGTARAFTGSGWRGPAARRFEVAQHEQRRSVDHACRALQAFAAGLELDALEVRRVVLLTGLSIGAGGRA